MSIMDIGTRFLARLPSRVSATILGGLIAASWPALRYLIAFAASGETPEFPIIVADTLYIGMSIALASALSLPFPGSVGTSAAVLFGLLLPVVYVLALGVTVGGPELLAYPHGPRELIERSLRFVFFGLALLLLAVPLFFVPLGLLWARAARRSSEMQPLGRARRAQLGWPEVLDGTQPDHPRERVRERADEEPDRADDQRRPEPVHLGHDTADDRADRDRTENHEASDGRDTGAQVIRRPDLTHGYLVDVVNGYAKAVGEDHGGERHARELGRCQCEQQHRRPEQAHAKLHRPAHAEAATDAPSSQSAEQEAGMTERKRDADLSG